jgi:homoserine kinase
MTDASLPGEMRVVVEVPATTANLGSGFDSLGLALELRNRYEFALSPAGADICVTGEGTGRISGDETHLGYRACMGLLSRLGSAPPGLRINQHNCIPLAGGLGSSATAVVAGLLAANAICGNPLSDEELLNEAAAIEGHPDNVAPALLGGFVICSRDDQGQPTPLRMPAPPNLVAVLAVPDFVLQTARAREVLPDRVPLCDAVYNVGRASMLVASFCTERYERLAEAMDDRLHQPYRAGLVPGMKEVCRAALRAGAVGAALSGAGPTLLALVPIGRVDPRQVGVAMVEAFGLNEVQARYLEVPLTSCGATVQCTEAVTLRS